MINTLTDRHGLLIALLVPLVASITSTPMIDLVKP